MNPWNVLDVALDRSIVLGYTRLGPALRRRWWPRDPEPRALEGKAVLVTGATAGIGKATAAGLARLGATVHVNGRDPEHLRVALAELRDENPTGDFHGALCDVGDLKAVRELASERADVTGPLHAIVHNAGAMTAERQETTEGHEVTLAVSVLGAHLLTELLREPLARAEGAIVVFMSSGGMYGASLHDDDPEFRKGDYSGVAAYARCKRMQVVLAQMWAERLAADNVEVSSMHPGWVDTPGVSDSLPTFRAATGPLLRSLEEGADTMIWLVATRPPADSTRRFWHDRKLRPTSYGPERDQDPARRRRLWDYVADATDTPRWS